MRASFRAREVEKELEPFRALIDLQARRDPQGGARALAARRARRPRPRRPRRLPRDQALGPPSPDAPVLKLDAPVLYPDAPVLKLDAPVQYPDAPVLKLDAPVLYPDAPVLNPDAPVPNAAAPRAGLSHSSRRAAPRSSSRAPPRSPPAPAQRAQRPPVPPAAQHPRGRRCARSTRVWRVETLVWPGARPALSANLHNVYIIFT
jgi:hypothetical protein